jgi:hypothetical protein
MTGSEAQRGALLLLVTALISWLFAALGGRPAAPPEH